MNFWINFWTVFFFASLAVFAGVVIVVSVGGFFDVRSLFKSLSAGLNEQADTVSWQEESDRS